MSSIGFKNVYYDMYRSKIHHWYTDEKGLSRHEEVEVEHDYYLYDPLHKSEIKDIYGVPVIKETAKTYNDLKMLLESGVKTCEAKISQEIKFLQKTYKYIDIKTDISNFNIGIIDIECAVEDCFPKPEEAKIPINLISIWLSKKDAVYTFGLQEYTGDPELVKNYMYCADEIILLENFISFVRKCRINIFSGWNCISKNEYIWFENKIIQIKNINDKHKNLCDNNKIQTLINTGIKEKYDIELKNGIRISSSNEHIFPVYYKHKDDYKNENALLKNYKECKVQEIYDDFKNNEYFFKIEVNKNKNKSLTYRDLIINNIDRFLDYDFFNIVIVDDDIRDKIVKYCKENNIKHPACGGNPFWKSSSNFWTYKKFKHIISKDEIINMLIKHDDIPFIFKGIRASVINISMEISNDILQLLGFVYTDGCLNLKELNITITNIDVGNIDNYSNIINKFRRLEIKKTWKTRIRTDYLKDMKVSPSCRIRFSMNKSIFSLLLPLIYNTSYKKELCVESLSSLSKEQFTHFFSGVIDGDGCVEKNCKALSVCDFTNNGIDVLSNLLHWNNCYITRIKKGLRIPLILENKEFIGSLRLFNKKRKERLSKGVFFDFHKKDRGSKKISKYIYSEENYYLVAIKSIIKTNEFEEMVDLSTDSGFFICNSIKTHNCKLFDLPYIINRCKVLDRADLAEALSPLNSYRENSHQDGYHVENGGYSLAGVSTLDYIDLYKNFTYTKREKYSLDAICMEEIKEGKVRFEGELNNLWKEDWNKFVVYNVQDVLLVKKLDMKLRLFDLAISMCHESLVPLEKVFSSVNLITGMVLKYCHKKNIVIPDKQGSKQHTEFEGAHVMAKEGYYKWCENFDIVSMYPTIIRAFNLSPETLVYNPIDNSNLIKTPLEGIYYKKEQGIIPEIVTNLFESRVQMQIKYNVCVGMNEGLDDNELCKRYNVDIKQLSFYKAQIEEENGSASYYDRSQKVVKIFLNSNYGAMGNVHFCLYNIDIAKTVTACGRDLIKYLTNKTDTYLLENWHIIAEKIVPEHVHALDIQPLKEKVVCLIDTDSGHVCFEEMLEVIGENFQNNNDFLKFTHKINDSFFIPFYDRILSLYADKYNISQIFKFSPEKIITKKIVVAMKKYVDEIIEKKGQRFDPPKLAITGIEIVRTDTPLFCRNKIKDIVKMIFDTEDKKQVLNKIRETKKEFFQCSPDQIAKPKGIKEYQKYAQPIQKYLDNGLFYPKGIPQHNRAGINYNYVVAHYKLPLKYIDDREKIKFVYLHNNNFINQDVIAMISNWPDKFDELFSVNYEKQWEVTFEDVISRFFRVLGWGSINLESNSLEDMFN